MLGVRHWGKEMDEKNIAVRMNYLDKVCANFQKNCLEVENS